MLTAETNYDNLTASSIDIVRDLVTRGVSWAEAFWYAAHDLRVAERESLWDFIAVHHGIHVR